MKSFFYLSILMLIFSCSISKKTNSKNGSFEELKSFMVGSFNSAKQAKMDSSYYDITLQMYPIWEDREGDWLYVEQSVTSAQNKPYRQRIYKLEKIDNETFRSRIYTLPNPNIFIGAWKTPKAFDALKITEIQEREGCEVNLNYKNKGMYGGRTGEKTCESSLRGASFATSIVDVYSDKIISWDQGFDSEGKQVWGATEGGYIFIKY